MVPGWRQGKKKDDLHIVFAPGKLVFQHTYTDRGPFRVVFHGMGKGETRLKGSGSNGFALHDAFQEAGSHIALFPEFSAQKGNGAPAGIELHVGEEQGRFEQRPKIGSYAVDLAVPDNGEQFFLLMIVQEVPAQDYRYICGLDGQGNRGEDSQDILGHFMGIIKDRPGIGNLKTALSHIPQALDHELLNLFSIWINQPHPLLCPSEICLHGPYEVDGKQADFVFAQGYA